MEVLGRLTLQNKDCYLEKLEAEIFSKISSQGCLTSLQILESLSPA